MHACVRASVFLSLSLSVCVCVCLSVSVPLSVCLSRSLCLSLSLSLSRSLSLSVSLSVSLALCVSLGPHLLLRFADEREHVLEAPEHLDSDNLTQPRPAPTSEGKKKHENTIRDVKMTCHLCGLCLLSSRLVLAQCCCSPFSP